MRPLNRLTLMALLTMGAATPALAADAGDVEQVFARPRSQLRDQRVLPEPMNPDAHQVVHDVVFAGDRIKDPAHELFLLGNGNLAKAEIGAGGSGSGIGGGRRIRGRLINHERNHTSARPWHPSAFRRKDGKDSWTKG